MRFVLNEICYKFHVHEAGCLHILNGVLQLCLGSESLKLCLVQMGGRGEALSETCHEGSLLGLPPYWQLERGFLLALYALSLLFCSQKTSVGCNLNCSFFLWMDLLPLLADWLKWLPITGHFSCPQHQRESRCGTRPGRERFTICPACIRSCPGGKVRWENSIKMPSRIQATFS